VQVPVAAAAAADDADNDEALRLTTSCPAGGLSTGDVMTVHAPRRRYDVIVFRCLLAITCFTRVLTGQ